MRNPGSLIFDTLAPVLVHLALVFALFLLFSGHNAPGGGFSGGLVASVGLVIGYLSRGPAVLHRFGVVTPEVMMGVGLAVAAVTGLGGWWWDDHLFATFKTVVAVPLFGEVSFTSALPFDIGVFLVVLGLAASVVDSLGSEPGGEGS